MQEQAQQRRLRILQQQVSPDTITTVDTLLSSNTVSAKLSKTHSLDDERTSASFNVTLMTNLLDEGSDCTAVRERFMAALERDFYFKNNDRYDQDINENRKESLQRALRVNELMGLVLNEYKNDPALYNKYWRHCFRTLTAADASTATRYGVHDVLFKGTLKAQAHDEMLQAILPLLDTFKIYGCYASTELGHGSNLKMLETTATYDRSREEFVIHSPTTSSAKFWVGGAGQTATHTILFAQLVIDGKSYGPHFFLVQLRCLKTHTPLVGVTVGDVGKKQGRDGVDNGYILFSNVRIPRKNMLMRWCQVKPDGTYVPPPLPQILYTPMLNARLELSEQSAFDLARGIIIAIRYACVRRQFSSTEGSEEQKLIDYQTHQYRLFPYLAAVYAMRFSCIRLLRQYNAVLDQLKQNKVTPDFHDLHATMAGMKVCCTWFACNGAQACQLSLGGNGHSSYAGLAALQNDECIMPTWEGDNHVLLQQTGRYLLKSVQQAFSKPGTLSGSIAYLNNLKAMQSAKCEAKTLEDFSNPQIQLQLLQYKAAKQLTNHAMRLQKEIKSGKSAEAAWNSCLEDSIAASKTHIYCTMLEAFIQTVDEQQNADLKRALKNVCDVFGLYFIDEDIRVLLTGNYLSSAQSEMLSEQLRRVMLAVRKDAVLLVDAFNYSDLVVNSPLGRYDGNVFEAYFDRIKNSPINKQGVIPYYHQVLHPHLSSTPIQY